ncbi:MAG TPA: hypothetical protein VEY93_15340 [Longimicrobium sp.]|nr:hypothetical protein [Longimicrobium sp.]
MNGSMAVLLVGCTLAACGTDAPPARTDGQDQAGTPETASKLTREAEISRDTLADSELRAGPSGYAEQQD